MEKIIHYCWFGKGEIPERDKKCMESWKKYLPDYTIMFWNEDTFPLEKYEFTRMAYECKKYAFVSDYVRVYALYNYGGIYFDTDYMLLKDISSLLGDEIVLGCENRHFVGTAIMAAPRYNSVCKKMLDYYNSTRFIDNAGNHNEIPNTMILTDILEDMGFVRGNEWKNNGIHVYPREVFFPKQSAEGKYEPTEKSVGIHYFNGSWWSEKERKRSKSKFYNQIIRPVLRFGKNIIIKLLGKEKGRMIENTVKNKMR